MKLFKMFFDLLLLLSIIGCLYFFLGKEPIKAKTWQNPFQTLPWADLKKVTSNHRGFAIEVHGEELNLKHNKKSYSVTWATFQKFMDNILILPEYQYFEKKDQDLAYGLNEQGVTFIFSNKSHTLLFGKSLPGDSSNFYLSLDGKLFTLPSVLRQNIDWPLESFIEKTPFYSAFDQLTYFNPSFQKKHLKIKRNKHQYLALNSPLPLKPYQALQRLFTMKEAIDLNPNVDDSRCKKFMQIDQALILMCDQYFYSPQQNITWKMSEKTIKHLQNFDLKMLSTQFTDYLDLSLDKIQKIQFPNGLNLTPKEPSFSYVLKLVKQSKLSFENRPLKANQSFLFSSPDKTIQLQGASIHDLYKFKINDQVTGLLPFKKFQSIYQ
ncbi:MAG: hypothetical protein KC646_07775 [Candidatus Cloacimonetes bacterium]|nr:hypothetical protein [Candidatus Cloacimonadota bacterium]